MAGHFLLKSFSHTDLAMAPGMIGGGTNVTVRQHAHIGWTQASRADLSTALAGGVLANRNNLPPHQYLQIPAQNPMGAGARAYVSGAGWVDNLERPACAGLGLRALCPAALAAWGIGNKSLALIRQIEHGNVSIEFYYVTGVEV